MFDADEILLDLRPAVTGGLVAVLGEMRRLTPPSGGPRPLRRARQAGQFRQPRAARAARTSTSNAGNS